MKIYRIAQYTRPETYPPNGWILPNGEVIELGGKNHVTYVKESPTKFNIDPKEVEEKQLTDLYKAAFLNGAIRYAVERDGISLDCIRDFLSSKLETIYSLFRKYVRRPDGVVRLTLRNYNDPSSYRDSKEIYIDELSAYAKLNKVIKIAQIYIDDGFEKAYEASSTKGWNFQAPAFNYTQEIAKKLKILKY